MHYFQFNIGEYASHTRHLSPIEDLAYRRLLDLAYTTELPITKDIRNLTRLINLRDYHDEVQDVLAEFFYEVEDGWINNRVCKEIKKTGRKSEAARNSVAIRWANERKANEVRTQYEDDTNAIRDEYERNTNVSANNTNDTKNDTTNNQLPITNNPLPNKNKSPPDGDVSQKQATPKKPTAKKTPIPADFKVSDAVRKWATEKGHSRLDEHFERFVGSCQAKGYLYADWDAALRNAIASDWAKLATAQAKPVDTWAGRDF